MKRFLLLFLLIASTTCFANRIHVNPRATDTADGTTWARAHRNLQNGFDLAQPGDTILVAAGIYGDSTSSSLYSLRIQKGLVVLGGYPNTGNPADAQRNWITNRTVLIGAAGLTGLSENILLINNITQPVVIDGFIMSGSLNTGLRVENASSVVVKNMLFEKNWGHTVYTGNSTLSFYHCVFYKNQSAPVINWANGNIGFYNCVITHNSGMEVIKNDNASLTIYNCTIANNSGIAVNGIGTGTTTIKNSIFWDNKSGDVMEGYDIKSTNHTLLVSHSITQSYYRNGVNTILTNHHPRFVNQLYPAGADSVFFTADDGLQLTVPCSPALNFGDNTALGAITKDIAGNPRIFNAGIVDLGAYELQMAPGVPLKTVYVNQNATGANNGSSWANAFTTLQQALFYCSDTIKIAAGSYIATNSKRDSVFSIESGKVVLGGYPASGNPSDADRNPWQHHTILRGNYFGTGTVQFPTLVKLYNVDSTTVIDGIKADNASADLGGSGIAVTVNYGSKLKILNCDFRMNEANNIRLTGLTITDTSSVYLYRCEFNTGYSINGGTAVGVGNGSNAVFAYCNFRGYAALQSETTALSVFRGAVTLDSCLFWRNNLETNALFVRANGGVLTVNNCVFRSDRNNTALLSTSGNSSGTVSNSVFRNVTASLEPALYSDNSAIVYNKCLFDSTRLVSENRNHSSPVFNNCLSVNGRFMWNRRSTPTINHSTIVNTYFPPNTAGNTAREELVTNEDSSVLRANNTIFWSARLAPGKVTIYNHPQTSTGAILTNCLTQNYGTHGQNGNIVGKVPRFNRLDHIPGNDGKLFTADDGLQLSYCSPAINAGNAAAGTVFTTDMLNNPRNSGGIIDMGAYEFQGTYAAPGIFYVNQTAAGNKSGVNWQNAYTNLQDALCNACADTIRVAEGVYKAAEKARDSSFVVFRPGALFGGYPATGNPGRNDRDAVKHPTILSGNINDLADSLDNTGTVLVIDGVIDSVHVEGFTIRDAYSSGTIGINLLGGGGMLVNYTNTGIRDCRFLNNRTFPFGGGLSISSYSTSTVSGCVFIGNSSSNEGGAISSSGYLRLSNSVFENNWSFAMGGAIKVNAGFDISNTVFYRNFTTAPNNSGVGGGLYAKNATGHVYNCSFVENKATKSATMGGGGMYFEEDLGVRVSNCIFSGNICGGSDTLLGADLDWRNYNLVHNSILQQSRPFTISLNIDSPPGFVDVNNPRGSDGLWLTDDDGLQLHYASAAVNHGLNSAVVNLPVDILEDARIVMDTVDAGAYEYQNRPVALAGADTVICTGNAARIGKEGNPAHIYSWTSSPAGFTSATAALVVNPAIPTSYFLQVSNGTQTTYDTIQVSLSSSLKPGVTIATNHDSVCAETAAKFIAIPLHEGAGPSYQWQVNGVNVGTDTSVFVTSDLQDGNLVRVILTSSASCATPDTAESNVITVDVTSLVTPDVTINGPVEFCPEDTVTYTVTAVNGGSKPLFKWNHGMLVRKTSYDSSYTTNTITDWTTLYVEMYSNAVCVVKKTDTASLQIMTKPTVTPSVQVTPSATSICGDKEVTFTAGAFGGGQNPVWQWKLNNKNVGANNSVYKSDSLKNGDQLFVLMTSSAECPTEPIVQSNQVTMAVTTEISPTAGISAPQTEVNAGIAVTVSANLVNGNGATVYQWQDSTNMHNWQNIAGASAQNINYTPVKTGDKIRCSVQSATNCNDPVTVQTAAVAFKVNAVTGLNPVPAANYGITSWPNPVSSFVMIERLKLSDQWQTLEILSVDGRQKILSKNIAGQTQVRLTTVHLKNGPYIIMLRKKGGEIVYLKFVKL